MANTRFMNEDFFDFSSIEKQIQSIKQNQFPENKFKENEQSELSNDNEELMNLLESQLTILIGIQNLLKEIEKNTRNKKRSFFSNS